MYVNGLLPSKHKLKPLDGFLFSRSINQEIIEIEQQRKEILIPKDVGHESHEAGWTVTEPLWQTIKFIQAHGSS